MSHYITTYNQDGKAVFSSKIPSERHVVDLMPNISMERIYSVHNHEPDVSIDSDIEQFKTDRVDGYPDNAVTPPHGSAVALVTIAHGHVSPMHRTMSLDVLVVLEGVLEMSLDSGEVRTVKAGDTITNRAAMHQWKNVSPNGGVVKMVGFAVPIAQPLEIGGKRLETEYHF